MDVPTPFSFDWSQLLPELLCRITSRITAVEDFISFGCVCSTWREATLQLGPTHSLLPLRWLMLPPQKQPRQQQNNNYDVETTILPTNPNDDDSENIRGFYSLTTRRIYRLPLPVPTNGKRVIETKGWLLTMSQDRQMTLFHPFARHVIPLPPQSAFGNFFDNAYSPLQYIKKAVLSSTPKSPDDYNYTLMVIHSKTMHLGFWKPGDSTWTVIETRARCYENIIFSKGRFYAVDFAGVIYLCDVDGPNPTIAVAVGQIPVWKADHHPLYLVEPNSNESNSMLLVVRFGGNPHVRLRHDTGFCAGSYSENGIPVKYGTVHFKVYEVDLDDSGNWSHKNIYGWREVNDLQGDRVLFMGHSETACLETSELLPRVVKHNCIYFTDDCMQGYWCRKQPPCPVNECPHGGGKDAGIYNLEDGTIERFYSMDSLTLFPPIWTFLKFK